MNIIPFSKNNIKSKDLQSVNKVLLSGWLTHGQYSTKFENLTSKFTGAKYACTISSCTAGLHIACLSLGLGKGDEVIVPSMTHTATSHAVEYTGAKTIFADIDYETGNINFEDLKLKITNKTKALILVHMAGLASNLKKIKKLCNKRKIYLIEDCAHALGSTYEGKHVGNFGVCGVFSFYPTKQITTGEGGMIVTNNFKFFKKVKTLMSFGIDTPPNLRKKPGVYNVNFLGYNYRMTDFQAALGYTQLTRYSKELKKRKSNALFFSKLINKSTELRCTKFTNENSYFVFQVYFKNTKHRAKAIEILKINNIGFSIHYATAVPFFNYYKKKYNFNKQNFPNAIRYSMNTLSIPINNNITKNNLVKIYNLISKA